MKSERAVRSKLISLRGRLKCRERKESRVKSKDSSETSTMKSGRRQKRWCRQERRKY